MADEIKDKIIWALGYVRANMDHIEELAEDYDNDASPYTWILSEEEADEIIRKVEEIWQKK